MKTWKRKGKKEDEHFQLLYYLSYMVKSGISGFPNPCTLQICKWFPTKIIIFEERLNFLHLIDLNNRLKHGFFMSIRRRKLVCSSKRIILVGNDLHICNAEGLGICLLKWLLPLDRSWFEDENNGIICHHWMKHYRVLGQNGAKSAIFIMTSFTYGCILLNLVFFVV